MVPHSRLMPLVSALALAALAAGPVNTPATKSKGTALLGWNNLGMHCMDSAFDVFAILPPFNNVHAHLIRDGVLVRAPAGLTVTYESVPDAAGSITTSSIGRTDFWDRAPQLFGASPAPDMGLAGNPMPGAANTPRPMTWDPMNDWWVAEGIPITPRDDAGNVNPYPMMRLAARDASGTVIATTDIVVPVSDEMDCRACHASDGPSAARPAAGWVHDADPVRDYKLNILRLHDDRQALDPAYAAALAASGHHASGLYATVTTDGKAVLCAGCHASNALGTTGRPGVAPLTTAVHGRHAFVDDPVTHLSLDSSSNRSSCYRCHPGSDTRCLRGAMGDAVAADATLSIQCQDCHGTMSAVGDPARRGWLDEPNCQNCHTGTATRNNGQIRYDTALEPTGVLRTAADPRFATEAGLPVPGTSLYRASHGHGGLACEACHGSTHAEVPSSHSGDNAQSLFVQGHEGVLVECVACHGHAPDTVTGGPHGMHPVGAVWVDRHGDAMEGGDDKAATLVGACSDCHGGDLHGTVLSRAMADRTLSAYGTQRLFRGSIVGCWTCHDGPASESPNRNPSPVADDASAATSAGVAVAIPLRATDRDGALTYRIVSQPAHGMAGIAGTTATYRPTAGFTGTDTFTFAARDGETDSNLATVQVTVGGSSAAPDLSAAWKSVKVRRTKGRDQITGVLEVTNVGAASAGVTTARIGLSSDGIFHDTDPVVRTLKVPALRAGVRKHVHLKVRLARGTPIHGSFVIGSVGAAPGDTNPANDQAVHGPVP